MYLKYHLKNTLISYKFKIQMYFKLILKPSPLPGYKTLQNLDTWSEFCFDKRTLINNYNS